MDEFDKKMQKKVMEFCKYTNEKIKNPAAVRNIENLRNKF
jgi:hypothetical protein